ncbi:MAG: DUF2306 domain-containing protein [Cytophagales bacterium]|nr:DUF2306 domain-containing protein [Cytophagales bacterium]
MRLKLLAFWMLVVLAVPLAFNALSYLNFNFGYGFLRLKQKAIETGWYLPAYYSHVVFAGLILLAGLFQIRENWRAQWPKAHKSIGKFYVFGILFFAAPGGFVMGLFIERGPWVTLSFILQCAAWIICTAMAFYFAINRNWQQHRNWMWRSYSLTLAAITLRLYIFVSSWSMNLAQPEAYATIAWLSWVPNLLICEWVVWLRKNK